MISQSNTSASSASLAIDVKDVNALRQAVRQNSPDAIKNSARQFEAMFMNMVMKSMRDATPQEGIFDNQQSKMVTSMLDQQMSQNLAKRGVGLADVLIRQLSSPGTNSLPLPAKQNQGEQQATNPATIGSDIGDKYATAPQIPVVVSDTDHVRRSLPAHIQAFRACVTAHAEEASRTTGIPAKFMIGQAALESGWGKREIKAADGTSSHNLFGMKATSGWKGKVVETATTEYVNGVVHKKIEKFRAYDSYADAFRDYAKLLSNNPRYQNVLATAQDASGFAQGLQKAGYATDPNYAAKLTHIIKHSLSV
jgi:peptidoglycan hydrolase FlgJ